MTDIAAERPAGAAAGGRRVRGAALLAGAALFMETLDATIIATAIPDMAETFAVAPISLNVGVTAYLVAVAACIPVSGWVAERLGPRVAFTGAVLLFTAASLLCGMSGTLTEFTAARVIQGVAGAMMTPIGRLVVLRQTGKADLMRAIAFLTWPALLAPAIAPPLGGLIVEHASWRWIFLINVPLGITGAGAAIWLLRDQLPGTRVARFDRLGFLLWTLAIVLLIGALEGAYRLSLPTLTAAIGMGAVLACAAVRRFLHHPAPLLDLAVLRCPSFRFAMGGGSLFRTAILASPFLQPIFFQVGLGMSAATSGLLLAVGTIGNILMKIVTTPVLRAFGFRPVLIVNGALLAASFGIFALVGASTPHAVIAGMLFVSGLARSMQFTALNTLAFADVPADRMSGANTLFSTALQLNGAMGVALVATVLQATGGLAGDGLLDYRVAFLATALLAILGVIDAFRLDPETGRDVSAAP